MSFEYEEERHILQEFLQQKYEGQGESFLYGLKKHRFHRAYRRIYRKQRNGVQKKVEGSTEKLCNVYVGKEVKGV